MEQYQIVKAESSDKDFVINLNMENMPAVGGLDEDSFDTFIKYSDYFKVIRINKELIGFMIALLPGRPYSSVNYKWFEKKYSSFVYIDRIVISFDYQNMGLGNLFYDDLHKDFKKNDFLTCEVNLIPRNDISMKFHKKYGFYEVGQQYTDQKKKLVSMQILPI
tara:strand:+ start:8 stop:496 length:489 start_codon:yes stop_codon:yes gene_type:complete